MRVRSIGPFFWGSIYVSVGLLGSRELGNLRVVRAPVAIINFCVFCTGAPC